MFIGGGFPLTSILSPGRGGPAAPPRCRRGCVGDGGAPSTASPPWRRVRSPRAGAHQRCAATTGAALGGRAHVRRCTTATPRVPAPRRPAPPRAVREPPLQRERPWVGGRMSDVARPRRPTSPRPGGPHPPGGSRTAPTTGAALRGRAHVRRCTTATPHVPAPRRPPPPGRFANRPYNGSGLAWDVGGAPGPTSPPPASHPLAARGRISDARLQGERPWVGGRMSGDARGRRPTSPRPGGPPHPGRFANRPYNGSGLGWEGACPTLHDRDAPRPRAPAAPTPRAVREPPLQRERPCLGWGAPPAPRPRPRHRIRSPARGRISDARLQRERPWVGGRMSDVA